VHFYPYFVKTNRPFAPTLNAVGSIQIKQNKINTETLHNRMKRLKYPFVSYNHSLNASTTCLTWPDRRTLLADREGDRSRGDGRSETVGVQTWRALRGPTMRVGLRARAGAPARGPASGARTAYVSGRASLRGASSARARPWTAGRASEGAAVERAGGGATSWRPAAARSGCGDATMGRSSCQSRGGR
jgi:hypothetical protein